MLVDDTSLNLIILIIVIKINHNVYIYIVYVYVYTYMYTYIYIYTYTYNINDIMICFREKKTAIVCIRLIYLTNCEATHPCHASKAFSTCLGAPTMFITLHRPCPTETLWHWVYHSLRFTPPKRADLWLEYEYGSIWGPKIGWLNPNKTSKYPKVVQACQNHGKI